MAVGDGPRHSPSPSRAAALIRLKVASRSVPAGTPPLRTDSKSAPAGSTLCKQFLEQPLRASQTPRGENHRLGLADRIVDQPLGMQPVHRVPVERLPRARTVVKSQP